MHYVQSSVTERPPFERFLGATIGETRNGMAISVLSALARHGLDPQREAERLATLPTSVARQAVAGLIQSVMDDEQPDQDVRSRAARLVRLLPAPIAVSSLIDRVGSAVQAIFAGRRRS